DVAAGGRAVEAGDRIRPAQVEIPARSRLQLIGPNQPVGVLADRAAGAELDIACGADRRFARRAVQADVAPGGDLDIAGGRRSEVRGAADARARAVAGVQHHIASG